MKHFIFILFSLLFATAAFAQDNDPDWEIIKKASNMGNEALGKLNKCDVAGKCSKAEYAEIQTLYLNAIDIVKPQENGKYPKPAKYMISSYYTHLAQLSYNYNPESSLKYKDAQTYVDKAFSYRPSLNSISFEDVKYVDQADNFKNTFSDQVYFAYLTYDALKKRTISSDYALQYIMFLRGTLGDDFAKKIVEGKDKKDTTLSLEYMRVDYILKYLAGDLAEANKKESALISYIDHMEFQMQKENFKIDVDEKKSNKIYKEVFDSIYAYVVKPGEYDLNGEQTKRAMNDFVKLNRQSEALVLARVLAEKSSPSADLLWTYADMAYKKAQPSDTKRTEGEPYVDGKEELKNALPLLEKNSYSFGVSDWDKMKMYYDFLGDKDGVARIDKLKKDKLKKERRAAFRENFGVSISTNPFLIGITGTRQIPLGLDIRTGGMTNGFRLNLMNGIKDVWHFGNWKTAKTDDGSSADRLPNHYSGYEFSYAMKFVTKKESHSGCELRYANYTFDPITTTVTNKSTNMATTDDVTLVARRYDFTINTDMILRKSIFFLDMYFGFGLGYKYYNFGKYSMKDYTFADYRYSHRNLKHIYLPIRAGFRVGFNII
jgi:hypothetical protein